MTFLCVLHGIFLNCIDAYYCEVIYEKRGHRTRMGAQFARGLRIGPGIYSCILTLSSVGCRSGIISAEKYVVAVS